MQVQVVFCSIYLNLCFLNRSALQLVVNQINGLFTLRDLQPQFVSGEVVAVA